MNDFKVHNIVWDGDKISRLWDYYSKTFPYNQEYFTKIFGRYILKKTQRFIGSLSGKNVLDYGCGPGFLLHYLVELNIKPNKYIGLDFSEESIKSISNNFNIPFPVETVILYDTPSSLKSESIDVCFLIEVIEHLDDLYLEKTLKEIQRVLKPDGKVIVTTPNNENLELSLNFCPNCGCIYHRVQHVRSWSKDSLKSKMALFGLNPLLVSETTFLSNQLRLFNIHRYIWNIINKNNPNLFAIFEKLR